MILLLVLACTTPSSPARPQPVELPEELVEQRARLREAEVPRLRQALDLTEDPVATAEVLTAGRQIDAAAFAPAYEAFTEELLTQTDRVEAARAAAVLYEASTTPDERQRWRAFATSTLARWRYTPAEREATLAEHEGVTRAMAHAALDTLTEVHVDPPESAALLAPGFERLVDLGFVPSLPEPTSDLHASIDLAVDRAVEAGTPESTAVAELVEAVFSGVDQWTAPVWPRQVAAWQQHHDGVVPGVVGVVVDAEEQGVFVRQVVEASPAWIEDVHVDDRLLTVDGRPVSTPEEAAAALRGEDGTRVRLGLRRGERALEIPVIRSSVPETTVMGWSRSGPGWDVWVAPRIAFLRIAAFRPRTADAFAELLPARATMDGLVLDLRGNAGGDLDAALAVADRFIDEGPLVRVKARIEVDRDERWGLANPGSPWQGVPIVVLVDDGTASSAEILAGALQQHGAHVVGDRTTGKGTGQLLRVDEDLGFAMQITHLHWAIADGTPIHHHDTATRWGIRPDTPDPLGPTERFLVGVLQARREALAVHADGSPMPYRGPEPDPGLPPLGRDPQITRAVAMLQGR